MRPGRREKPHAAQRLQSSVRRPEDDKLKPRTLPRRPNGGEILDKQRRPGLREEPRKGPAMRNGRVQRAQPPRPRNGQGLPPRQIRGPPRRIERGAQRDRGPPKNNRGPRRDNRGPPITVRNHHHGTPPRDVRRQSSDRGPSRSEPSTRGPPPREMRGQVPPREGRGPPSFDNRGDRGPPPREDMREPFRDGGRLPPPLMADRPYRVTRSPLPFRDDSRPRDIRQEPLRGQPPRSLRNGDGRLVARDTRDPFSGVLGPHVRDESRGYREDMPPSARLPLQCNDLLTPPPPRRGAGTLETDSRMLPPPIVRQALLMRSRSPLQKRPPPPKTGREDDAPKRAREAFDDRKMERPLYGSFEGELRLPKKDLRKIPGDEIRRHGDPPQRRPAPARDPEYGNRGIERPSSPRFGASRGRGPPLERPSSPSFGTSSRLRGPPVDHPLRDQERRWNDAMHILRMEELQRMQMAAEYRKGLRGESDIRPLASSGLERREMQLLRGRGALPLPREVMAREMDLRDARLRPVETRRSLEREMDRREREWRAREVARVGAPPPSLPLRGRSADRTSGFLLPPSYRRPF